MSENRTGKYLKYAIGEIILVVIGILIALQVNNWNQEQQLKKSEIEFYKGIKNDLTSDLEYIQLIIDEIKPKLKAFETINNEFPEIYRSNPQKTDSLLRVYLFKAQRTFYPTSGTYQSALSENQLSNFKNKEMLEIITRLYQSDYSRLLDNGILYDERWTIVSKEYSHERRMGNTTHLLENEVSKLLDDIFFHFVQMRYYKNVLESTNKEIKDLLEKIKSNL